MTIVSVNQNMIDKIADDDTIEGLITYSINVDPGNPIQTILGFTPDTTPMPDGDITAMNEIAELWDDLIARDIEYVSGNDEADITVNRVLNLPPGVGGQTYSTLHVDGYPDDIDVFLPNLAIMAGTPTWRIALHEFGHALGLEHPGDYDAGDSATITYANDRTYDEDTALVTVMSYFDAANVNLNVLWSRTEMLTPMIYDILAIQQLYGADTTTRTGDTTYGFNSTADRSVFLFAADVAPVLTIWDAGGSDTLDTSGFTKAQRIDMRAGSMSDVGGLKLNVGIAFNVSIENAIGGTRRDDITGNALDNTISGLAGNDILKGDGGDDTLLGGDNSDKLFGDGGDDELLGGMGNDELSGGLGNDTLEGEAGDDKLFGGFGIDKLFGGDGDDLLDGGGSRNGFGGDGLTPDELTGGDGEDTFVYVSGYQTTIITDFTQSIIDDDRLDLKGAGVHSFGELLSKGTQQGADTVFNFGAGNVLTLQNFDLTNLDPDSVMFSEAPSAYGDFVLFQDSVRDYGFGTHTAPTTGGGFFEVEMRLYSLGGGPPPGGYFALIAHRFDNKGSLIDTIQVNTVGVSYIDNDYDIRTAVLSDGKIVVAWMADTNNSQDGVGEAIMARIFNADGTPNGAEFVVNTTPPVPQPVGGRFFFRLTDLETSPSGGFFIDWFSNEDPDDFRYEIHLRRRGFDSDGNPAGPDQDLGTSGLVFPYDGNPDNTYLTLSDGRQLHYWQARAEPDGILHVYAEIVGETVAFRLDKAIFSLGVFNGVVNDLFASELEDGRIVFTWKQQNYYPSGGNFVILRETQAAILDSDLQGFTRAGTAGNDTFTSVGYNNLYHGLVGSNYNDQLYGLEGNDELSGRAGADLLHGGEGIDTADYSHSLKPVVVNLARSTQEQGGHAQGDILISIENLTGSAYADQLTGDRQSNLIRGGYGNDTIEGGGGADFMFGDKGQDSMRGGNGSDSIIGGDGDDRLFGELGNDTLEGNAGDDYLQGDGGRDVLIGGVGFDYLSGGDGNDFLYGGEDSDVLSGNLGTNTLEGGTGNDRFLFRDGFATHKITDFEAGMNGSQDLLDVSEFDFADLTSMLADGVTITTSGNNTIINFGLDRPIVNLIGVSAADITDSDFRFI